MSSGPVTFQFRVRYGETDQMGTFYNARALEWFECGRTELLRAIGTPYAWMEQQGAFLPLTEAHVEFLGRARYDDLLEIRTTAAMAGKASLRFDMHIVHASGAGEVVRGWTVHAITNSAGRPIRPPAWLIAAIGKGDQLPEGTDMG